MKRVIAAIVVVIATTSLLVSAQQGEPGYGRMPGMEDTGRFDYNGADPDKMPAMANTDEGNIPVDDEPGHRGWNPTKRVGHRAQKKMAGGPQPKMPKFNPFKDSSFSQRHPERQFPEDAFGNPGGGPMHPSDDQQVPPSNGAESDEKTKAMAESKRCLVQAVKICPMRIMHENFAAYTMCVFDNRNDLPEDCHEWGEFQGACVQEMLQKCNGMDPESTTDCMVQNKEQLSSDCTASQFYESLEEGYEAFKDRIRKGSQFDGISPDEDSGFDQFQGDGNMGEGGRPPGGMPPGFGQGGEMPGQMPGAEEMMKNMMDHFPMGKRNKEGGGGGGEGSAPDMGQFAEMMGEMGGDYEGMGM